MLGRLTKSKDHPNRVQGRWEWRRKWTLAIYSGVLCLGATTAASKLLSQFCKPAFFEKCPFGFQRICR